MYVKALSCESGFAYTVDVSDGLNIIGNGVTFVGTLEDCGFMSIKASSGIVTLNQVNVEHFKSGGDLISTDTNDNIEIWQ